MTLNYYKIFFIQILTLITFSSYAQNTNIKVRHIKIGDTFAKNEIRSIIQDQKGFMWFATKSCLYRYNGYSFKQFKNNPDNKYSLSNDAIETLFEDKKGMIWVGTENGLNKFNPDTEKFSIYKQKPDDSTSISNNIIYSICEDSFGFIWIGTDNGLNKFDTSNEHFYHYFNNDKDSSSLSENDVRVVYLDSKKNLWIGTNGGGINLFNERTDNFQRFLVNPLSSHKFASNKIRAICEDKAGDLWIGTFKGLGKLDAEKKIIKTYNLITDFSNNFQKSNKSKIKEFLVYSIAVDHSGTLWVSSQYGLLKKEKNTFQEINYNFTGENQKDANFNFVSALYIDKSEILWLGTYGNGIFKMYPSLQKFINYSYINEFPKKLNISSVRVINEIDDKRLIVGGYYGLDIINRKTNKISHLLGDAAIYTLQKDPDNPNILWIGKDVGGLVKYDLSTKKIKQFKLSSPTTVKGEIVSSMLIDSKGILWVGTEMGLNKFNRKTEKSVLFSHNFNNPFSISNNKINVIYEDSNGLLWVGTNYGLNIFNRKTGKFKHIIHIPDNPNSLSYNVILSIYEDKNNFNWIGTNGGGIDRYDKKNNQFKNFSTINGLPNNVVYGILEDEAENLWLSTNNGLSKFNPKKETFWNFDENFGLQDNEFNRNAYFKSQTGEMFFGGIKGMNAFFPGNIKRGKIIPPIAITNFQLGDKTVHVGKLPDGRVILTKSIWETKSIELLYSDYVFTFEYASLEYYSPTKTKYAIMLQGLDKQWSYVGNRRFATYNSIPPGDYIFRVKAQNNTGIWNEKGASINISITPPFWKTYWFYVAMFLTIIYSLYLIFQFRINQLLKVEKLRIKLASNLHDDIGATLSKISMQAEIVRQGIDPKNNDNNLTRIAELCSYSINTMRDIVWSIDSRNDTLEKMLNKMKDETFKLLEGKNIEVKFTITDLNIRRKIHAETRQNLYLILKEAVNNIYKHSNAKKVEITVSQINSKLSLKIHDNGNKIDIKKYNSGHGLSNMQMRAEQIGGELSYTLKNGFTIIVENIKLK